MLPLFSLDTRILRLREKSRGFLFLLESLDQMQFPKMTGYVILPVHTQVVAAISGFYFGGGLAK